MPSSVDLFTTCAGVIPTVLLALVVNALGAVIQTGGPDARVRARWHRDYRVIFIVLTLNAALAEAVCLLALTAEPAPPTALRWYVAVSTIFLVAALCAALVRRMIFQFRAAAADQ